MKRQTVIDGANTAANVAAHFREIKARADALVQEATAQGRGYFVPEEDVETKSILASYWTARNALLEFLLEYKASDKQLSTDVEKASEEFVTAFTVAILLVDAARFLREKFHDLPLVRSKLNEPSADFHIPVNCYDQVQASLFSARNAWHLYHAIQYFREHRETLVAATNRSPFDQLWPVIDELEHRLDVPLSQYAKARFRARGRSVVRRLTLNVIQKAMYGLQKFAGVVLAEKYLRLGHEPSLADVARKHLEGVLRPGDILVVRKEYAVTNYFLPGYWPHAALYLGTETQLRELGVDRDERVRGRWQRIAASHQESTPLVTLESMKDGVHLRTIDSPYRCDSIVVLRLPLDQREIGEGLARALSHEGKPYDFSFDFRRADQLVCTEVAYRGFEGIGGLEFPLVRRAGRPTLSGSDLIELAIDGRIVQPAAVFAPGITNEESVVEGSGCLPILQKAINNRRGHSESP